MILAVGTLVMAGGVLYSAHLTRVLADNQERVRPILTLTYAGIAFENEGGEIEIPGDGNVAVRNIGKSPAFPLHVRIESPGHRTETIERFGVTAGGQTNLFGSDIDISAYDGALFTLTYGDVDHRQYESKLRCDVSRLDLFRWEA
jgi:hypothetical protein